MRRIIVFTFCLMVAIGFAACSRKETGMAVNHVTDADDVDVILVTMDGTDEHWAHVHAGASAAADELGVAYRWMAPDKKDTALQIEVLNDAIAARPDVLCVAAVEPEAIITTLQSAADAGIQIIYVDSAANFDAAASFCTDNYAAAYTAGEMMLQGLQEKGIKSGNIGIVAFSNATQTSVDREQGFRDALEGSAFTILETQYGNSEVTASQAMAERLLSQGVVGIYGNNEKSAIGVGNAVAADPAWDGIAVGFDATDETIALIESGALYCTMAQKPYEMGYGAMQAAVKIANGEQLERSDIDTGVSTVTAENVAAFQGREEL